MGVGNGLGEGVVVGWATFEGLTQSTEAESNYDMI